MSDFTSLGSSFANARFFWDEYKDFLHGCNGTDNVLFDADGNLYPAKVPDPTGNASGAAGAAGLPDGVYKLYVSFLVTWPNAATYETGITSGSADVTVSEEKISWSSIPTLTYAAYSGTAPTIYRKLYRGPGTGGSLGNIYYVATITDNTTTTYTDEFSDAALAANGTCDVEDYEDFPSTPLYIAYHYSRLHYIGSTNRHRLYHSEAPAGSTASENEAIMPLMFQSTNWDDLRSAGFGDISPQGLLAWGDYLYIPLKHTWIRRDGNDPSTWAYKKTWANMGISAPHTLAPCPNPAGILGISSPRGGVPGISVFNGSTTRMITGSNMDGIFEDDLNQDQIANCFGKFDGRYYLLLYPSGSNTLPDKFVAFDLDRFPDIRVAYWCDLNARCLDVYEQGDGIYLGTSTGYVMENSGTESINIDVETHDLIGGDPELANTEKTLKSLKYSINSGGDDVTLYIYIDDELMTWTDDTTSATISGTDDSVQYIQSFPNSARGYKYKIRLVATGLTTLELYSPWEVEFD